MKYVIFILIVSLFVSCGDSKGTKTVNKCENVTCDEWKSCNADNGMCELKDGRCLNLTDCGEKQICNENHICINEGVIDYSFTIDANRDNKPVSPYIFGTNAGQVSENISYSYKFSRLGGNRWTGYNWETNASNAGSDWYHSNDSYLGGDDVSGKAVTMRIDEIIESKSASLITIPIVDYVAGDKNGNVYENEAAPSNRFKNNKHSKGSNYVLSPDLNDNFVYQDEFINFLKNKYQSSFQATGETPIFISLDNEPDLWNSTHPRIHQNAVTYAELVERTINFSSAVKNISPDCLIFGFVSYGFNGLYNLQDASDKNNYGEVFGDNFIGYYLSKMKEYEQTNGIRILDVLDIHWYPEAQGGGQRITVDSFDNEISAARIQAPRSLWDENYTEDSWIGQWFSPVALIKNINTNINNYYPDTKLAITEYYYGGGNHISGGLAQADVLGIFAKESVFAASIWHLGETNDEYIKGAFTLYLNPDNLNTSFGETYIYSSQNNASETSFYSAKRSDNTITSIFINKTELNKSVSVSFENTSLNVCNIYTIDETHFTPYLLKTVNVQNNSMAFDAPKLSASSIICK